MRFIVRRQMTWDGTEYYPGDSIEIPEGHPYLSIEGWRSRFLSYDNRGSASAKVKEKAS